MSESGVIPRPERKGREIGRVLCGLGTSMDVLAISVRDGDVYIGHPSGWPYRLDAAQREEFSRLYFEAIRQAEATMPP